MVDQPVSVRFIYQAYDLAGRYAWIYDQTLYSMLSLMSAHGWDELPGGVSILAYVDAPEQLQPLTGLLDVRKLDRARIIAGMGEDRFIHRLKLDLLLDAARDTSCPILYLDGDIYFKGPLTDRIASLGPGQGLMYARELPLCSLNNWRQRKLGKLVARLGEIGLDIPPDAVLYNAGAVGLHPADFGLLQEALDFTDRALETGHCHIWEQLALSVALGRRTKIGTLCEVAHHYWDQREEYAAAISPIIETIRQKRMSPADAVAYVRERPLDVPPYRRPGFFVRAWRKITGRGRMPSIRIQDEVSRLTAQ